MFLSARMKSSHSKFVRCLDVTVPYSFYILQRREGNRRRTPIFVDTWSTIIALRHWKRDCGPIAKQDLALPNISEAPFDLTIVALCFPPHIIVIAFHRSRGSLTAGEHTCVTSISAWNNAALIFLPVPRRKEKSFSVFAVCTLPILTYINSYACIFDRRLQPLLLRTVEVAFVSKTYFTLSQIYSSKEVPYRITVGYVTTCVMACLSHYHCDFRWSPSGFDGGTLHVLVTSGLYAVVSSILSNF